MLRKRKKRNLYGVPGTIAGFLLLLLFASGLNIGAFFSNATTSTLENRTLEKKPVFALQAYFSGEYCSQWERYINDHVPARDSFIQISNRLDSFITWKKGEIARIEQVTADIGVQEKAADAETQGVLVLPDRVRELYQYNALAEQQYIQAVNAYALWISEGIQCYHMLVPMPVAFEETEYQNISDNQQETIKNVYRQLDSRIQTIDAYTGMLAHSNETLYFRTDHHWNSLGARYGAEAFAQIAQIMIPPLQEYVSYTLNDYIGPLGSSHITESIKANPDDVTYYLYQNKNPMARMYYYEKDELKYFEAPMINTAFAEGKGDYGIFLSGDYPVVVVQGNANNERVLAVIKDSYGNALVPWLTEGFEKIICIDPRSCRENLYSLMAEYQVTDVLILNYIKVTSLPAYSQILLELIA